LLCQHSHVNKTKFDPKACNYVFVGYKTCTKGYIFQNLHTEKLFVFKNVIFYESVFLYCKSKATGNEIKKCSSPNNENHINHYTTSLLVDPQV